jgi:hypothetical protein
LWQDSWLEPGRRGRIFDGCSSNDQLSCLGKIPDLAGVDILWPDGETEVFKGFITEYDALK